MFLYLLRTAVVKGGTPTRNLKNPKPEELAERPEVQSLVGPEGGNGSRGALGAAREGHPKFTLNPKPIGLGFRVFVRV